MIVYSFIVVPIFMEWSLDRFKETKEGRLRIKSNSFVIRFFYGANAGRSREDKSFPKNVCQLYKGIYGGVFFFFFIQPLCFILIAILLVMIYGIAGPISFIFGRMPNPVGFIKDGGDDAFYPYERIGDRKWIAPWKFILPVGFMAIIYFRHREIFVNLIKISRLLSSTTAISVYCGIAGFIFLIIIINKIRKIKSFIATKEVIISFVKRMCKEIDIA